MEEIKREEIEKEVLPIKAFAETLVVRSDADNQTAADYLKRIKSAQNLVHEKFDDNVKKADQLHKSLVASRNEFLKPLEIYEKKIKSVMVKYEQDCEAERRRLQIEQEAEARRIEEEARKAAETAAKLADKGKDDKAAVKQEVAETLQARADEIRQTVIEKPMAKVPGISYRDNWKAIIKSPTLIPREYLIPNQSALDAVAKATKGTLQIPGVEFRNDRTMSSRTF